MRRKFSRGITVAAVAVTVAGVVSSCGAINTLSAKQQVSQAMSSLSDAKSATFTMSLGTSSADIQKISAAEGDPISASDLKVLDTFLAGDVQYSIQAADGKKLGDSMDASRTTPDLQSLLDDPAKFSAYLKQSGAFSMSVRLSGDALVELRMVDGVIYARAAVRKIMQLADQDPAQIDDALADLPRGLEPLRKAAKGAWISVDLNKVMKTLKDDGTLDGLPTSAPTASVDPNAVNKLLTDLQAAYEQKVTITELGDGERGKSYRLSAPAKQVAAAVQDDLIALVGKSSASDIAKAIDGIPDKPINLVVSVDKDTLSGVSLDLTQFLDKPVPGAKLSLDVAVDVDSGKVSAPSDATALDVQSLIDEITSATSDLASSMGGSFSGSGTGDLTGDLGGMDQDLGSLQDQIDAAMASGSA